MCCCFAFFACSLARMLTQNHITSQIHLMQFKMKKREKSLMLYKISILKEIETDAKKQKMMTNFLFILCINDLSTCETHVSMFTDRMDFLFVMRRCRYQRPLLSANLWSSRHPICVSMRLHNENVKLAIDLNKMKAKNICRWHETQL